jgi:hypothetical protein
MSDRRAVMAHQGHARIGRKIINFDTGRYGICAWAECDQDANSLYQTRAHEHARSIPCDDPWLGRHITYAFCSERHKLYWDNATGGNALRSIEATGRAYGNLPVGDRGTIR